MAHIHMVHNKPQAPKPYVLNRRLTLRADNTSEEFYPPRLKMICVGLHHMRYSLNSFKGGIWGILEGTVIGVAWSLDYMPCL